MSLDTLSAIEFQHAEQRVERAEIERANVVRFTLREARQLVDMARDVVEQGSYDDGFEAGKEANEEGAEIDRLKATIEDLNDALEKARRPSPTGARA